MNLIARTLAAALVAAAAFIAPPPPGAMAADASTPVSEVSGRVVRLGLNKSLVIDVGEDVRDVLVSSPGIADAVVRSNRRVFLIGVGAGETNVFLFGDGGRQLAQFELVVSRDVYGLQQIMTESIPGAAITTRSVGDGIVLTGTAPTNEAAAMAADLAAKFIGDKEKVVNMLTVAGNDQVHVKVVVAEVQREVLKDLGVNTETALDNTIVDLTLTGSKSLSPAAGLVSDLSGGLTNTSRLGDLVKLLEERTAIRTLAEPTLTAISGEQANFLAGGEYPIPVTDSDGKVTIEFKKFGIQLAFRPVVVSPGRISLQVMTEVSELSDVGAVQISGLVIPSLSVRRAESTVELPSGGSIVMAGLIKDNVRQTIKGFPALMDVPILGNLFKSREFQRAQTELAIFVSPYLVDPVATGALTRPDKNLNFAGDAQAVFLNHVNKVYRSQGKPADGRYYGSVGFSFE